MFFNIDDEFRIVLSTYKKEWANKGYIEAEPPFNYEKKGIHNYKIINGEFIYDPISESSPPITFEEVLEQTNQNTQAIGELGVVSSENTLAIAELGVTTTQASSEQMLGMAEVGTMLSDIIARLDKAGI